MKKGTPTKTPAISQTSGPVGFSIGHAARVGSAMAGGLREDAMNPWSTGVLSHKLVELILKCAAVMSIHSSVWARQFCWKRPSLRGKQPAPKPTAATPACDRMKSIGQWNSVWDPFYQLDPEWTDAFMATGASIYGSGVMPAKEIELISIALDASYTHMYAPGTRRHIHNALQVGATMEEIMEVAEALCGARRLGLQSRAAHFSRGTGRSFEGDPAGAPSTTIEL